MSEIMFIDGLISEEDLAHYGTPRHSGRYPWGSGKNPYHHGGASPSGRRTDGSKMQLSDKQKKALKVGAIAAGSAIAIAGAIYMARSGKLDALASMGKSVADKALEKVRGSELTVAKRETKRVMNEARKEAEKEIRNEFAKIKVDRQMAAKARRILSDDEISKRITRLEQEKKLKELIRDDLYPGKKAAGDVLSTAGKRVLTTASAGTGLVATEYLLRKYFKDEMEPKELAKAVKEQIRPKKK